MVDIEKAISFLKSKVGRVYYSMYGSRNFSDGTCDCSGAVYTALRQGGASDLGYIASTETLHGWLKANGFSLIAENSEWAMKRGDVVIWGRKGQSAGSGGHTGICIDNQNWLECTAYKDLGETVQNHDARWEMNDNPYFYVYRLTGNGGSTKVPSPSIPNKPNAKVNVTYALRKLNGSWLNTVTNFSGGSDGYAGEPSNRHDLLMAKVNHGTLNYRVHTSKSGWLDWVSKGDKSDIVNGCAGEKGQAIDGVQLNYITPKGEAYNQAYYRSQTTERKGWLRVACDDGNSVEGFDNFAGVLGEPLDRLQISISDHSLF